MRGVPLRSRILSRGFVTASVQGDGAGMGEARRVEAQDGANQHDGQGWAKCKTVFWAQRSMGGLQMGRDN